jgi:type I restriction-modification system DNA methylase subunit
MGMLTLQELEATLWKAADILRGELNAAEYKGLHIRYVVFKADE